MGGSLAVLRRSWAVLKGSWAVLEGLGGLWGGLGAVLEGSCFSKLSRFKLGVPDGVAFYRNPYRTDDLGPFCRDSYGTLI